MAKKGGKQVSTSGDLELIQAKFNFSRVCAHGSTYCRACYGYTTQKFEKRKK